MRVGDEVVLEEQSPSQPFSTVFEDDGGTGYFYALDHRGQENPIVDALCIYTVATFAEADREHSVQICWSDDGMKSGLLVDGLVHAVFDFAAKRGFCRIGFPPSVMAWNAFDHRWSDAALDLLR